MDLSSHYVKYLTVLNPLPFNIPLVRRSFSEGGLFYCSIFSFPDYLLPTNSSSSEFLFHPIHLSSVLPDNCGNFIRHAFN